MEIYISLSLIKYISLLKVDYRVDKNDSNEVVTAEKGSPNIQVYCSLLIFNTDKILVDGQEQTSVS